MQVRTSACSLVRRTSQLSAATVRWVYRTSKRATPTSPRTRAAIPPALRVCDRAVGAKPALGEGTTRGCSARSATDPGSRRVGTRRSSVVQAQNATVARSETSGPDSDGAGRACQGATPRTWPLVRSCHAAARQSTRVEKRREGRGTDRALGVTVSEIVVYLRDLPLRFGDARTTRAGQGASDRCFLPQECSSTVHGADSRGGSRESVRRQGGSKGGGGGFWGQGPTPPCAKADSVRHRRARSPGRGSWLNPWRGRLLGKANARVPGAAFWHDRATSFARNGAGLPLPSRRSRP